MFNKQNRIHRFSSTEQKLFKNTILQTNSASQTLAIVGKINGFFLKKSLHSLFYKIGDINRVLDIMTHEGRLSFLHLTK